MIGRIARSLGLARRPHAGRDGAPPAARAFHPRMLRPFTRADFTPVPDGWRCGGPDFVGVGSAKSGTSWWFDMLLRHPSVVANRVKYKELHYFMHFAHGPLDEDDERVYREAFAAPEGAICGEWSVYYMFSPAATCRLASAAPAAKLLVLLRDPVDRLFSQENHLLRNRAVAMGLQGEAKDLYRNFSLQQEVFSHSTYAAALRRLYRHYPRERVLVLQYEKCKADPVDEYRRTCLFLGIDPDFMPPDSERKVNAQPYLIPKPTDRERAFLGRVFGDELRELAELAPEIDLSLWKSLP